MYQVNRNLRAVDIEPGDFFDAFVTADDDVPSKPDPTGLELCAQRLGVSLDRVAYVGDHGYDIRAAHAAKAVLAIAIDHGFHAQGELTAENPSAIISNLADLTSIVGRVE